MKKTISIIKIIITTILVIIVSFIALSIIQNALHPYKYTNDIECINNSVKDSQKVIDPIFKYDTTIGELMFYYTEDRHIYCANIRKALIKQEIKYSFFDGYQINNKNAINEDKPLNLWQSIEDIEYIYVKNKDDYREYNADKGSLIGIELTNIHPDGTEETFWVFIVEQDNGVLYNPSGANVIYT